MFSKLVSYFLFGLAVRWAWPYSQRILSLCYSIAHLFIFHFIYLPNCKWKSYFTDHFLMVESIVVRFGSISNTHNGFTVPNHLKILAVVVRVCVFP